MGDQQMRLFHVLVAAGEGVLTVDGIAYEGKLWLVPAWFDFPAEKASKPVRMIRFDNLHHQQMDSGPHQYVVNEPVPKDVLDGTSIVGFETLSGDQITFGIRRDADRFH